MIERLTQFVPESMRMGQEYAWRYQGIVNAMDAEGVTLASEAVVVEVGPSDSPRGALGSFIDTSQQLFLGIDRRAEHLSQTADNHSGRVVTDAADAALRDGSVDLLVSTDVIEHMDNSERKDFFSETFRILKPAGVMVCGFPTGETGKKLDHWYNNRYKAQTGQDHPYLKEHIENGLPDLDDTVSQIEAVGLDIKTIKPNCNQLLWRFDNWVNVIRRQQTDSRLENLALRTAALAFAKTLQFTGFIDKGGVYRQIVIAQKPADWSNIEA